MQGLHALLGEKTRVDMRSLAWFRDVEMMAARGKRPMVGFTVSGKSLTVIGKGNLSVCTDIPHVHQAEFCLS